MLLLLLMYLSPFVAVALYWRAQAIAAGVAAGVEAGDGSSEEMAPTAWTTIRSVVEGRLSLARPVVGGFAFAALVVAASTGGTGAALFLVGVVFAMFSAAVSHAASAVVVDRILSGDGAADLRRAWIDASAINVALASLAAGCVGGLAWFFADPSGAVQLVTFLTGASCGSLFLAMSSRHAGNDIRIPSLLREETAMSSALAMQTLLPAVAAVMMIAATAEPESLLSLGGLMAETETLRSELLLLPVAVVLLAPILAVVVGPAAMLLLPKRGSTVFFDIERVAAALAAVMIVVVVVLCGLSWSVAGAFTVGLLARQVAVFVDQAARRPSLAARSASSVSSVPSMLPAVLATAALLGGEHLAGAYGIGLAALGMAATFAASSSSAAARGLSGFVASPETRAPSLDLDLADAATTVAATLALLMAAAPVLLAENVHRGGNVPLVVTAAPALLGAVMAGAALAASLSARYAGPEDEAGAVRLASRAVVLAAALPVAAGIVFGAGAAVGVALGFVGWAAASLPLANGEDPSPGPARLRRSVMLAWARTMALAALISAPMIS